MLAVVAAGDVNYTITNYPYDVHVNLSFDAGAPRATAAWQTVLRTAQRRRG